MTDVCRGRICAGFHTDLNFLTIHGQSRYPGRKLLTLLHTFQRCDVSKYSAYLG